MKVVPKNVVSASHGHPWREIVQHSLALVPSFGFIGSGVADGIAISIRLLRCFTAFWRRTAGLLNCGQVTHASYLSGATVVGRGGDLSAGMAFWYDFVA